MVVWLGQSGMDIVVRGASAAATLTVTTSANGSNGFATINGIAIDNMRNAPATISAATSNVLDGNIITTGPLASLALNNWNGGYLQAGGSSTGLTTITGDVFNNVDLNLGTKLNAFTVAADTGTSTITAASFGTIAANGKAASDTPGNFAANLISTNLAPPSGIALSSATVAGTLSGQWELAGSVGTVTVAVATSNWALGVANGPGVSNAGLLTNVTTLTLGIVTNSTIFAAGSVGTLKAVSVSDDSGGTLQAKSFGTITTTGKTTTLSNGTVSSDHGNFVANITATGNAGGAPRMRSEL